MDILIKKEGIKNTLHNRINEPHFSRYGGMIPYDYDLDVLVDYEHWRTPKFLKFLKETKQKYGYKYVWRKSDFQSFSIDYSETNDNGIGFWTMRRLPNGKVYTQFFYKKLEYPHSHIAHIAHFLA